MAMSELSPPSMPSRLLPAQLTPTSNHEVSTPLSFAHQGRPPSKSPSPSQSLKAAVMSNSYSTQPQRSMVSAESPTGSRRKGARGPGKKEPRERPTVSVRWEEGDLTDRLIQAIQENERWSAVFAQAPSSGEGFHPRPGLPGVPKRDLHREIARYLFKDDSRYAGNDKTQWEALAVSVKNKLFKLQGLYNDCRTALGDHAELPQDVDQSTLTPEHLSILSQVREKFPQYWRLRDILARLPAQGTPQSPEDTRPGTSSASGVGQFYAGPSSSLGKRKAGASFEDLRSSTRPAPFANRPTLSPRDLHTTHGGLRPLPSFLSPSPPLEGPSIADILGQLIERLDQQNRTDEKRRYQARERWFERELQEREKQRTHDREMMKLRIQLARARGDSQALTSPVDELEPEEEDLLIEAEDGSEDAEGERDDSYMAADDAQDTPTG